MARWAGSFGPLRQKILVADKDNLRARFVAAAIAALLPNAEVEIAASLPAAEGRLRQLPFAALVVGDLLSDPFDTLARLRPLVDGPLVMIGATALSFAVEAMRRGADDVLLRPVVAYMVAERLIARMAESTEGVGHLPVVPGFSPIPAPPLFRAAAAE